MSTTERKGVSQEQSKLYANLFFQFSGSFVFPSFPLLSCYHRISTRSPLTSKLSCQFLHVTKQARILLYFPPVVRSRGNIHSHSLGKLFCKAVSEVCPTTDSGIKWASSQSGILRHVVRRPSPHHFATSISSSRFLSAAMEDRSS